MSYESDCYVKIKKTTFFFFFISFLEDYTSRVVQLKLTKKKKKEKLYIDS